MSFVIVVVFLAFFAVFIFAFLLRFVFSALFLSFSFSFLLLVLFQFLLCLVFFRLLKVSHQRNRSFFRFFRRLPSRNCVSEAASASTSRLFRRKSVLFRFSSLLFLHFRSSFEGRVSRERGDGRRRDVSAAVEPVARRCVRREGPRRL